MARLGSLSHLLHARSWFGRDGTIAGWYVDDLIPQEPAAPPAAPVSIARRRGSGLTGRRRR